MELLIVIAILVAFMAIGAYWLSAAKYRGNQAICTRNLHSIGQVLENYRADHRGMYPALVGDAIPSAGNRYGVDVFLSFNPTSDPYIGNKLLPEYSSDPTIFYCPLSDIQFDEEKWYKEDDNTWHIPEDESWSYTYLARHYDSAGHTDEDVLKGRVLAQCVTMYGSHNTTGSALFDRETPVLYDDLSVQISDVFKW